MSMLVAPPEGTTVVERAPSGHGSHIRPFMREDLPAVVELRQQVFKHTARPGAQDLTAFFTRAFFDNPWRDLDLPSYVHLDAEGRVNGFVGVVPRAMRFEGRPIRVAVPTQLMMRPGAPAGSGLRLVRAIFEGPQDLTISDAANEAARKLWERIGGVTSLAHSLFWTLPLRRSRYALARLARHPLHRAAAFMLRPACNLVDRCIGPRIPAGPPLTSEPFDPTRATDILNQIMAPWKLQPVYGAMGLAWALEEVARKPDCGPLEARLVRDQAGLVVGWFLYFVNRGGVGEVVQLAARPGDQGRLLAPLVAHARSVGVVALAGRMEPEAVHSLMGHGVRLDRDGPWFLTHARDPRLLLAMLSGEGFLSRLEGEWWLNF